jgi:hypothetical protein
MGVTTTIPPNLLAKKIQAHAPPTFTAQRHTGQGMATTHHTNGWRGQKISAQYVSTLQGSCSHHIRRRTATSKAIFFVFLFHSPYFHPFTTNVTRALPLEAIKGKAGATSKGAIKQQQLESTSIKTTHHAPPLTKDIGSALSLESL